jgi:transcriptional regulator with XRE-family HTH domain
MIPNKQAEKPPLGRTLRHWRQVRNVSQLDLALDADISARHLSFIETGRAQPSREVVLQLAAALNLSLRHQNALLVSAGYAPEYRASNLDDPRMARVRYALKRILAQHNPYPAMVVNQSYDLLLVNQGFERLAAEFIAPEFAAQYHNLYQLVFAPDGLQPFFVDWPTISAFLLLRLREEAMVSQNQAVQNLLDELSTYATMPRDEQLHLEYQEDLPVLSFALQKGELTLRFFSTITTFGTPQDITVQELRIENLFPADEATQNFFGSAA